MCIGKATKIVTTMSFSWTLILLLLKLALVGSTQFKGKIFPEFRGSKMSSIDSGGIFLVSNNSNFGFGFQSSDDDVTLFFLSVIHMSSKTLVWSANSDNLVSDSDIFVFEKSCNAYLEKGDSVIWSTNTTGKAVSAIELRDSGNLVLIGEDGSSTFWESFSHPSDTLLSGQDFVEENMTLSKRSKSGKLSYVLEIKSGDMVLSAGYNTPQPYWSMRKDSRTIFNKGFGEVSRASINGNSWRFYDRNGTFMWQFIISSTSNQDTTWAATLGDDGSIAFLDLQIGGSVSSSNNIPGDTCSTPETCDSYLACHDSNQCRCLPALASFPNCRLANFTPCSPVPVELVSAGNETSYFALGFVSPSLTTDLNGCKASCLRNCSCLALFFEIKSGNCFLFDGVGAFQASGSSSGYTSYIKVPLNSHGKTKGGEKKRLPYVVAIAVSAAFVIVGLVLGFARFKYMSGRKSRATHTDGAEEDDLLSSIPGNPTRFSYKDLETATNNFSVKLGQGGFGSVYQGTLPNGTRLAVKKLEAVIGQGNKEFQAEVRIIGSIHHVHLVRLKGFCVEGSQKLLAYEYMGNGSLDKWIFRKNKEHHMLSWDTRYTIALGTAKGLAYLHEDCESKIVHCDIKPENVLLDDNFLAKVSDFGLAKLMTREQSHVFTTLRGTRGYLAPEWITNYAISEKSDVYSYGVVLLEIVGGRKSYDPSETSEKSYFPSLAFKKLEEGKFKELLDSSIEVEEGDERVLTAIKVALWCIQEDMSLRPSMAKVVQMLEGVTAVPHPPASSPLGSRLHPNLFRITSDEGTSTSGTTDRNDDSYLSDVQLSCPR